MYSISISWPLDSVFYTALNKKTAVLTSGRCSVILSRRGPSHTISTQCCDLRKAVYWRHRLTCWDQSAAEASTTGGGSRKERRKGRADYIVYLSLDDSPEWVRLRAFVRHCSRTCRPTKDFISRREGSPATRHLILSIAVNCSDNCLIDIIDLSKAKSYTNSFIYNLIGWAGQLQAPIEVS